ncbi:MAG: HAD-IB family phosphatase [Promethearchaeota archaeon]
MPLAILCDFDGTIVNIDTAEFLLEKFTKENWRLYDKQLERGEINLKECMQKQYSLLKAPKAIMIQELEQVTQFRPYFDELVEYSLKYKIPFIIVSAGLDFVISHFIKQKGFSKPIKIHAANTRLTENGIEVNFPRLFDKKSLNFKEDLVKHYKKLGYHVIYIGDGLSDYTAVRSADFSFVIKNSSLASLCKKEGLNHLEIINFREVLDRIKEFNSF